MRILLAAAALAILAGPALADPTQPAAPSQPPALRGSALPERQFSNCDENGLRRAEDLRRAPVHLYRLGQLPPADMHLLVIRQVGGCSVPTIVVHDVERNITLRAR